MAIIQGYNSLLRILRLSSYGNTIANWDSTFVHNDVSVLMQNTTQLVNRPLRSGKISLIKCLYLKGMNGGTVSISGQLTNNKYWLLRGIVNDYTTISLVYRSVSTLGDNVYSATIIKDYGSDVYDIATGCVMTSLDITFDDIYVNFSATYIAQLVKLKQSITGYSGTKPNPICLDAFTKHNTISTQPVLMLDASLNISNEYDGDNISYGIKTTKSRLVLNKQTVSILYLGILNSTLTLYLVDDVQNILYSVGDGTHQWLILISGKILTVSIPDLQRLSYVKKYKLKGLVDDNIDGWLISIGLQDIVIPDDPILSPILTISPSSQNFGLVLVGSSLNKTYTLTNSGNTYSNITSITLPSGYTYTTTKGNAPFTLNQNSSATITVTFTPTQSTTYSGNISIYQSGNPTKTASLTGIGTITSVVDQLPVQDMLLSDIDLTGYTSLNADTPLSIPSYVKNMANQDLITHPSVLYFENGWNGYKYWMAMTPYPDNSDKDLNPSIVASNDNITWVDPTGITNPIDVADTQANGYPFNSDPSLFMSADNTKMYCVYRQVMTWNTLNLYVRLSTNGITWSSQTLLMASGAKDANGALIAPSLIYDSYNGLYKIWYNNIKSIGGVTTHRYCYRHSDTLMGLATATQYVCTQNQLKNSSNLDIYFWHHDVKKHNHYYWFCGSAGPAGTFGGDLYFGYSKDGLNWVIKLTPILSRRSDLWDRTLYKPALLPFDDNTNNFKLWYASIRNGTQPAYVGYTTILTLAPVLPPIDLDDFTSTNAAAALDIPVYQSNTVYGPDGTTVVRIDKLAIAPSVILFSTSWNGYKYWMAFTPYPDNNVVYQKPSIVASNDNITWVNPTGITNPIVSHTLNQSDPYIFMSADNTKMYCVYRLMLSWNKVTLRIIESTNGTTWTNDTLLFENIKLTDGLVQSPVIIYDLVLSKYKLWYINKVTLGGVTTRRISYRLSTTITGLSTATQLVLTMTLPTIVGSGYINQFDIVKHNDLYWLIATVNAKFIFGNSTDGKTFTFKQQYLLEANNSSWDRQLFSPSITPYDATNKFKLWYSSISTGFIGYTTIQ